MAAPQKLLPPHQPPAAKGSPNAVLDVAADFAAAMPEPTRAAPTASQNAATTPATAAAGLVDKDGTPFNPALHRTKSDGSPFVHHSGKVVLRNKKAAAPRRSSPSRPAAAAESSLDLTEAPIEREVALGPTDLELDELAQELELTPAEKDVLAQADAETTVDVEEILLEFIGPAFTPDEKAKLIATAARAYREHDVQLPIGSAVLHGVHLVKAAVTRATTDLGQEKLQKIIKFFKGEK